MDSCPCLFGQPGFKGNIFYARCFSDLILLSLTPTFDLLDIIYGVTCYMCDAIYICNTQQTFKKRIDFHFSDLQRLLKNGQKSDSFAAHFVQHFNNTTSHTDLRKCIKFKVIKKINMIFAMKTFTKRNCNLCMQEHLTILKNLRDKRVKVMNKNLEIYEACRHKTTFHQFFLITDGVFNG